MNGRYPRGAKRTTGLFECFVLAAVAVGLSTMTTGGVLAGPGPGEPTLEEVRTATERFQDVNVALSEGYIRDPGDICETAEMLGQPAEAGAMGIHFFRPDLLGLDSGPDSRVDGTGTHMDFLNPSVLIYEPQADGSLELVAVENLVFMKGMKQSGMESVPSFHGVAYDKMVDDPATEVDEAHFFEPHYDRHVWVYRENPNGAFTSLNPAVTCEHHQGHGMHQKASSGG